VIPSMASKRGIYAVFFPARAADPNQQNPR
jgi:hypothetical protein